MEKDLGWKPIPLFDREHREDIASMQVNAISMLQPQTSMLQLKCLGPSDESGAPNLNFTTAPIVWDISRFTHK